MLSNRFNRFLLIAILVVSLFLLSDNYFLPLKQTKGVLVSKTERADGRLRIVLLSAERQQKLLSVPLQAYDAVNINDTILVGQSYLTHTILQLKLYKAEEKYSWHLGFVSLGGMDFLLLFVMGIPLVFWLYTTQVKGLKQRSDITLYILSIFVVLLVLYFLFS